MYAWIHVFLPSFVETGKEDVTKLVRDIPDRITLMFGHFLWDPWSVLTENFIRSLFLHSDTSAKFSPNQSGF